MDAKRYRGTTDEDVVSRDDLTVYDYSDTEQ